VCTGAKPSPRLSNMACAAHRSVIEKTRTVPIDFFHTKIPHARNAPDYTGVHAQKPLGAIDAVCEKRFYCPITEPIGFKRCARLTNVRHGLPEDENLVSVRRRGSTRRPKAQMPPHQTALVEPVHSQNGGRGHFVLSWAVPTRRVPILSAYYDTAVSLFWQALGESICAFEGPTTCCP
jgi:hypothetical protein